MPLTLDANSLLAIAAIVTALASVVKAFVSGEDVKVLKNAIRLLKDTNRELEDKIEKQEKRIKAQETRIEELEKKQRLSKATIASLWRYIGELRDVVKKLHAQLVANDVTPCADVPEWEPEETE
jgi:predicted RNase H-like nuclease (RuvC/YqgF family)